MNKISVILVISMCTLILFLTLFTSAQPTANSPLTSIWQTISAIKQEIINIKASISQLEQHQLESRVAIFNITAQTQYGVTISCDSDETATGGGTDSFGDTGHSGILEFYPINTTTWYAKISGGVNYGTLRLICVKY